MFFINHRKNSGIYNVGTGEARTYMSLTKAVFKSMKLDEKIGFVDTPDDLRGKYQYYTCADIRKLRSIGYNNPFFSLEEGIEDYVSNYLSQRSFY
jgi:ADP-L-glycero-D-manno-heptose 6-epimerase